MCRISMLVCPRLRQRVNKMSRERQSKAKAKGSPNLTAPLPTAKEDPGNSGRCPAAAGPGGEPEEPDLSAGSC